MNEDEISIDQKLEMLHARLFVVEKSVAHLFYLKCIECNDPDAEASKLTESLNNWIQSELSHLYVGHHRIPAAPQPYQETTREQILEYTHDLTNAIVTTLQNRSK